MSSKIAHKELSMPLHRLGPWPFAVIAILLALGLWAYAGVRDSHPRTDTPVSG